MHVVRMRHGTNEDVGRMQVHVSAREEPQNSKIPCRQGGPSVVHHLTTTALTVIEELPH